MKTTHFMETEEKIVRKMMFDNDAFSQWLGIDIVSVEKGAVELCMTIREEMTNGFDIAHGGIAFSLADSALAFAANSYGIQSVTVETSTSFIKAIKTGDRIRAKAKEIHLSGKFGRYFIELHNQNEVLVAVFYGTVFRTGKNWII